jgi:LysM repeat protein
MRRGRSPLTFIILNVVISAAVALGLVNLLGGGDGGGGTSQIVPVTVQILVTSTADPDGDATRVASAVDATIEVLTADAGTRSVDLPSDILTDLPGTPLPGDSAAVAAAAAVPSGCIVHSLAEGEFPASLAVEYNVSLSAILLANELTEDDAAFLQIGQELIIPVEGCPIDQLVPPTETPTITPTASATLSDEAATQVIEETNAAETETRLPTATETGTPLPTETEAPSETPTPTVTPTATPALAPTAVDAQVQIVEVLSPGDITAEGVRIVNVGNAVSVAGWTITDAQGNAFVLPEQRLFTNGSVTIYTRPGEDTPIVFFWGRSTAVWGDADDVVTLRDANGRVQSSVRVQDAAP